MIFTYQAAWSVFCATEQGLEKQELGLPFFTRKYFIDEEGTEGKTGMNAANLNGKAANPEFAYLYFYTPQILYIRDMQAKQTYHLCLIDQTAKQQKLLVKTICADDKGNIAVRYTADESYAVDAWRYIGVQEIFEQMQPCAFVEGES